MANFARFVLLKKYCANSHREVRVVRRRHLDIVTQAIHINTMSGTRVQADSAFNNRGLGSSSGPVHSMSGLATKKKREFGSSMMLTMTRSPSARRCKLNGSVANRRRKIVGVSSGVCARRKHNTSESNVVSENI